MVVAGTAPDEPQRCVRGRPHGLLAGCRAGEQLRQPRLAPRLEHAVQRAAPDVPVHEQRSVPGVGEREGEVRGDE